jgi:ferredoxin-NADP reductase
MASFQTVAARLTRSTVLSEVTKHLEFEVEGAPRFGFVPGQWLISDADETCRRADHAGVLDRVALPNGSRFALCLNRVQDGFMSNYLCDLEVGAEISGQGPFGNLILRPPLRDTIFIATGTGIAPYRSMLHGLFADAARHQGKRFWLVFGSRYERDIYYHEEFLRLADGHKNFDYLPTLSQGSPRPPRLGAGARARHPARPHRHARLHLRTRQDGQCEPRTAEGFKAGSEVDLV